jgi:hypothetical protein
MWECPAVVRGFAEEERGSLDGQPHDAAEVPQLGGSQSRCVPPRGRRGIGHGEHHRDHGTVSVGGHRLFRSIGLGSGTLVGGGDALGHDHAPRLDYQLAHLRLVDRVQPHPHSWHRYAR